MGWGQDIVLLLRISVMRFRDKTPAPNIYEPEGENTDELFMFKVCPVHYLRKFRIQMLRTIPGLENVEIMRTAHAIEYDCIDPTPA